MKEKILLLTIVLTGFGFLVLIGYITVNNSYLRDHNRELIIQNEYLKKLHIIGARNHIKDSILINEIPEYRPGIKGVVNNQITE